MKLLMIGEILLGSVESSLLVASFQHGVLSGDLLIMFREFDY